MIQPSLPGEETEIPDKPEALWPLKYKVPDPWLGQPRRFWCHDMYRGPGKVKVQVLYSKTLQESEIIARKFFDEPILGFDMEWVSNSNHSHSLGACISLIQLACEDKIALFHIALHAGKTVDKLIAPSLCKILEDSTIKKAGVAVLNADFSRLRKFFHLKPRGAFELSHLHNLITFGGRESHRVTTRLVKLGTQVETHLGLPLFKGSVRTSKWNRALTVDQIKYAASDAYCGFMLYHCMNSKRASMDPCPPLPLFADSYPRSPLVTLMLLEPTDGEREYVRIDEFYAPKEDDVGGDVNGGEADGDGDEIIAMIKTKELDRNEASKKPRKKQKATDQEPLDAVSQALFDELRTHRTNAAIELGQPVYCVANNAVLLGLARERPLNEKDMLAVKGIGKKKTETWGADWLKIITDFVNSHDLDPTEPKVAEERNIEEVAVLEGGLSETQSTCIDSQVSITSTTIGPITRKRKVTTPVPDEDTLSSSPAFSSPMHRLPVLHTGLSFGMDSLDVDSQDADTVNVSQASSDDSLIFYTPLSHLGSVSKRRRSTSPVRAKSPTRSNAVQAVAIFTPGMQTFRNKLVALSRVVRLTLASEVRDAMINQIVSKPPRTAGDLGDIPGARVFVEACVAAKKDLLKNILKWAPDMSTSV
ncbi:hypothetical protein P154DRAFT_526751 [Amniculicola lignicola CBS 123094]|uniref:HRDC domain-containing protein n=1 Tax=Amniculicola lignicola CBS 123094 TaxID=1392246 RepID=A0A6A5VYQ0_9PLEO|nr:hypothetical protein P154DRAFT_526751 [Amniculicola lignicola CBS 123094]